MNDCTPTLGTNLVAFDFSEFMRTHSGPYPNRDAAVPMEVISIDQARAFLQFSPDVVDTSPVGGIT